MKKSYGKVHRYRTAFGHTAGFWVRRVGLLAAAGLLLFLLGWVIGPAVINAGTSAWYGVKNGTASSSEPASSSGEEGPRKSRPPRRSLRRFRPQPAASGPLPACPA